MSYQRSTNAPSGWERIRLTWRLLWDPRVPAWAKAVMPILAMVYLLSPVDLVPDLIVGLGQVDDLGVLGLALYGMTRLLPRICAAGLMSEHRRGPAGKSSASADGSSSVVDAEYRIKRNSPTS